MKRALILPLLTINSGHHHVAESVQKNISKDFHCEKVELLSYTFGRGEAFVSQAYLKWITYSPSFYSTVYKRIALSKKEGSVPFKIYRKLFLSNMKKIISVYQPDIIICSHALPSHLLQILKVSGEIDIPVINTYTDFFINELWGTKGIDLHLVPDSPFIDELMNRNVLRECIVASGILTDDVITLNERRDYERKQKYEVMISGGAQGTGKVYRFIQKLKTTGRIRYNVLCGRNRKLFDQIRQLNNPNIQPFTFIQCKKELNDLYTRCDGIISKPGGVTMSECLKTRIPIFIYDYLPGQEEYNFNYLRSRNLVQNLRNWKDAEAHLLRFLDDKRMFEVLQKELDDYHIRLEKSPFLEWINESIINTSVENIKS